MNMMFQVMLISFVLPLILILLNSFLAKKVVYEREKPSAFECGFDPKSNSRTPFSLRFFLIALIFLIFDVEITLILPIPVVMNQINTSVSTTLFYLFILILILGLGVEWKEGALEWK